MMSHEIPHPAREGLGRGRPDLQAKAAQHAPQAHLDIMALGLQELAGGQKRADLLGRERLAVHRPEPAQAHQLGNAAGVLSTVPEAIIVGPSAGTERPSPDCWYGGPQDPPLTGTPPTKGHVRCRYL